MARSLHLDQDGSQLKLSVLESEVRRRLWWHLLSRDRRSCEDYGLENTSWLLRTSKVALPSNLDDSDFDAETTQLPTPRKGWTAMTYSLVNIQIAKAVQRLDELVGEASASLPPSEMKRKTVLQEVTTKIETLIQNVNPVVPGQRLTRHCSRFLLRKVKFVSKIHWALLQQSDSTIDLATEENLLEALEILQAGFYDDDALLGQLLWARKANPQYHVTMYVLWHLCFKPASPNASKAWEIIETLCRDGSLSSGSKSSLIAALRAKAIAINVQNSRNAAVHSNEDPSRTERSSNSLNDVEPWSHLSATANDDLNMFNFPDEWPNWETLAHGFQLDSPDALWL